MQALIIRQRRRGADSSKLPTRQAYEILSSSTHKGVLASSTSHLRGVVELGGGVAVVPRRHDDGVQVLLIPLLAGDLLVQVVGVRAVVLAVKQTNETLPILFP
eukprot:1160489-Pelagomonas_calceolata.AAC.2